MSLTSAENGPERSASIPRWIVDLSAPKSVLTSEAPFVVPSLSDFLSSPQAADTRARTVKSTPATLSLFRRIALPPCLNFSIRERPALPVGADPHPDAVQTERFGQHEDHEEHPVEELVELEDR